MNSFFLPVEKMDRIEGFALFGREHIAVLVVCAAIITLICLAFRLSHNRRILRIILGAAILLCEMAREANLIYYGVFDIYYLPLHLCSISVFICFLHSLFLRGVWDDFIYCVCMPGAVMALLMPEWTSYRMLSYHSLLGFFSHTLLVSYPAALAASGDIKPKAKNLPKCFVLLLAISAIVYLIDISIDANYMFLQVPPPGSPLVWFEKILGRKLFVLGYIPIIAILWIILYLPTVIKNPSR